jgi:micrococcal nuclease
VGKSGEHHLRVESNTENPDRFGRKFIYLWKDGELVNEQLVKEGYVLANLRSSHPYKNSTSLSNASQYARLMGKGVWNPDRPLRTLPADFRREQR